MTCRRVTLEHWIERKDGTEVRAELVVDVIEEKPTWWEPGYCGIEPVELSVDDRPECLVANEALVNRIIEMVSIPAPEEY